MTKTCEDTSQRLSKMSFFSVLDIPGFESNYSAMNPVCRQTPSLLTNCFNLICLARWWQNGLTISKKGDHAGSKMIQDCFKTHINLRKLIRDSKQIFIWKYLPQFRRYLTDWQNSVAHNHFQPSILPGAFPWKRMPSGHRAQLWAACPVPHVLSSSLILLIVNVCRCNILLSKRTGRVIMWSAYWSHEPTYSTRATWAYHLPFKPHGARIPHRPASHLPQPALPVLFPTAPLVIIARAAPKAAIFKQARY